MPPRPEPVKTHRKYFHPTLGPRALFRDHISSSDRLFPIQSAYNLELTCNAACDNKKTESFQTNLPFWGQPNQRKLVIMWCLEMQPAKFESLAWSMPRMIASLLWFPLGQALGLSPSMEISASIGSGLGHPLATWLEMSHGSLPPWVLRTYAGGLVHNSCRWDAF